MGNTAISGEKAPANKVSQLFVPAFIVLGDVIPVLSGIRKAASFFFDFNVLSTYQTAFDDPRQGKVANSERPSRDLLRQLSSFGEKARESATSGTSRKAKRELLKIQKELCQWDPLINYRHHLTELGVRVTPIPFIRLEQEGCVRVYLSQDPIDLEKLLELNLKEANLEKTTAFAEYDGFLHGYPPCCIGSFTERRSTELKATSEYLGGNRESARKQEGTMVTREDALNFLGESLYQFFSEEFYPCSLSTGSLCQTASTTGLKIYQALKTELSSIVAQDFFLTNRNLVHDPDGRSSYTTTLAPDPMMYQLPYRSFLARFQ